MRRAFELVSSVFFVVGNAQQLKKLPIISGDKKASINGKNRAKPVEFRPGDDLSVQISPNLQADAEQTGFDGVLMVPYDQFDWCTGYPSA